MNKILTLIGAILYSFTPLLMFLGIFLFGNIANYYSNLGATSGGSALSVGIAMGILIFLLIISLVFCAFNWIAFVKIDGSKGKSWKVYLLVAGIVICVFQVWFYLIGAAPGILFILAFAINHNKQA